MEKFSTFFTNTSFINTNKSCVKKQYILALAMIFLLALLHFAATYTIASAKLHTSNIRIDKYIDQAFPIYGFIFIAFLFLYPIFVMLYIRPRELLSYLKNGYLFHLFSKERLLFSYPVLAIIPLDFSIYTSLKNDIPKINPFYLDNSLYKLDRVLFLGNDPWRLFQPLIGNHNTTRLIDFLYSPVWIWLLIIVILYHALGRHSLEIRLRYFLVFILILGGLGNVLATILSSAGPCYFDRVTEHANPYAELISYLYSIKSDDMPLIAVRFQQFLWNSHVHAIPIDGSGISAMPSIHVAIAALFALSMRKTAPIVGKMLYCYLIIIWVGSIHLGWHYAVDGLVSLLCVLLIWYYSGKLTKKIIPKEAAE